jgi:CorA-like Mg2+ transporter protein
VAELTILLDPLQAQIKSLQSWKKYQQSALQARYLSAVTAGSTFDDAIKMRDVHLESLKRLLNRATELQALVSRTPYSSLYYNMKFLILWKLFQLSNIETANLQSEIALQMAKETQVQVDLAKRNESQNKSIMVFTVITVIFLPLSFFTSYFGKS